MRADRRRHDRDPPARRAGRRGEAGQGRRRGDRDGPVLSRMGRALGRRGGHPSHLRLHRPRGGRRRTWSRAARARRRPQARGRLEANVLGGQRRELSPGPRRSGSDQRRDRRPRRRGRADRLRCPALAEPAVHGPRGARPVHASLRYDDGSEPLVVHHWLAKPWLEPTHHGVYSQLLQPTAGRRRSRDQDSRAAGAAAAAKGRACLCGAKARQRARALSLARVRARAPHGIRRSELS